MTIIGISGLAGSGKSTCADFLAKNHGFVVVSLADEMKRICMRLFGFTYDQMFGPSASRNAPDERYLNLTPRFALQTLGTEFGRRCYEDVWVDYTLRVAKTVLDYQDHQTYTPKRGLKECCRFLDDHDLHRPKGVVISDVRFRNELDAIRKAGGKLVRIVRPGAGLQGAAGQHVSETEQAGIRDDEFDAVIVNDSTLENLEAAVKAIMVRFA